MITILRNKRKGIEKMKKRALLFSVLAGMMVLLGSGGIAVASEEAEPETIQEEINTEEQDYQGIVGIVGEESNLTDGFIVVETKNLGDVEIFLTENTTYKIPGEDEASKDDVTAGKRVAVLAVVSDNDTYTAYRVMLIPSKPTRRHLGGVIVSVEDGIMTIQNAKGETMTVELPEGVKGGVVGEFISAAVRQNTGKANPVAEGIRTTAEIQARLQAHLDKVASMPATTQAEIQKREKAMNKLEKKLEGLCENTTAVLEQVRARVSAQVKTALQAAVEKSEEGMKKAQSAIDNARERIGGQHRNTP